MDFWVEVIDLCIIYAFYVSMSQIYAPSFIIFSETTLEEQQERLPLYHKKSNLGADYGVNDLGVVCDICPTISQNLCSILLPLVN